MELNLHLKSIIYGDRCWCKSVINKNTVCDDRIRLDMTISLLITSSIEEDEIILQVQK